MNGVRKYWAFARVACDEARSQRGELYGRSLFFVVILAVFAALWRAVAEAGMPLSQKPQLLVWYLAVTEWVLLSAPLRHLEIQEEVRRGDVVCQLTRPVSYPRALLAQCAGMLVVRAPWLGVVAFLAASLYTGELPKLSTLALLLPFGLLASLVLAELYLVLGLVAFWLRDASPLYWVCSKLMFILGGLMLPLELYPRWLQLVAASTPFPSLLAGPGGFVLHGTAGAASLALRLLFWAAALFGLLELVFWRATRTLQLSGG
jgi:ABC-2 type transport system permease protein